MEEKIDSILKVQNKILEGQEEMRKDIKDLQEGQEEMRKDIKDLQERQEEMEKNIEKLQVNVDNLQKSVIKLHKKTDKAYILLEEIDLAVSADKEEQDTKIEILMSDYNKNKKNNIIEFSKNPLKRKKIKFYSWNKKFISKV